MAILIRKPGILSTIQDLGRTGVRDLGINPGGTMDRGAARVINLLLGNPESAPVLEMHFPAAEIEFTESFSFAIGGADLAAELDESQCSNWTVHRAERGSVVKFRKRFSGHRAYLAVAGGFDIDRWLGSASTNLAAHLGGHLGRQLQSGDRLECSSSADIPAFTAGNSLMGRVDAEPTVRVVAGPEFALLTAVSERTFLTETFQLTTDSNRMGFRLRGTPLGLLHAYDMVSSAVTFGTIQLLPDGQMIVLMADHQTSGGYPRIANVVSVDLPVLAQCGPGDRVRFKLVSIDDAERLALRFERELNFLRVGCRLQTK